MKLGEPWDIPACDSDTRVTQSGGVRGTDEIYFLVNVFYIYTDTHTFGERGYQSATVKNDERCPRDKSVTDDRRHFLRDTFQAVDANCLQAAI